MKFSIHTIFLECLLLISFQVNIHFYCHRPRKSNYRPTAGLGSFWRPTGQMVKTNSYKSKIDALLQDSATHRTTQVQDNNENHPPPTCAGDAAATNVPPSPKNFIQLYGSTHCSKKKADKWTTKSYM